MCRRGFVSRILTHFGKGVREILREAADVLQNKLTRAQYLDEVTWTTKNWLGAAEAAHLGRSLHGNRYPTRSKDIHL